MATYIHSEKIHNTESAKTILPLVFELASPQTVLDVGCGIGTWLYVSKKLGATKVVGVDGDYVDRNLLYKHLDCNEFNPLDISNPLTLDRKFDLAICLEVAEHLPEESACVLVNSLIEHSDIILFSAAIPGQGGQNHLNEQWPKYWANIFEKYDFVFLDIIRPLIWDNPKVDFWYKQNIFLVVKKSHSLAKKFNHSFHSIIHPDLYLKTQNVIYHSREREFKLLNGDLSYYSLLRILIRKIIKLL